MVQKSCLQRSSYVAVKQSGRVVDVGGLIVGRIIELEALICYFRVSW